MKQHKFHNETFEFDLTLVLYTYKKKKDRSGVSDIMEKLGYSQDVIQECIEENRATVIGSKKNGFILFDINGHDDMKGKSKTIGRLKTLAHECNHIKENLLKDIGERNDNKETECSMRISDWCFKKCLGVPFFKKMLK